MATIPTKLFSTLLIVAILLAGCAKKVTSDDVIKAFKDAGLEAEHTSNDQR